MQGTITFFYSCIQVEAPSTENENAVEADSTSTVAKGAVGAVGMGVKGDTYEKENGDMTDDGFDTTLAVTIFVSIAGTVVLIILVSISNTIYTHTILKYAFLTNTGLVVSEERVFAPYFTFQQHDAMPSPYSTRKLLQNQLTMRSMPLS